MADQLTVKQLETFLSDSEYEAPWRREAAKAMAYFDGNQLSAEQIEKAADRGLPPLVRNLVGPTIRLVLGMEAKNRRDWMVLAEGDADFDRAAALNALMKATERATKSDAATSAAYASQVKAGVGWVEVGYGSDPWKLPLRVAVVPHQEIYWDWRARDPFLSDARFLARHRWFDLDLAKLYFPGKGPLLEQAVRGWADWDQGHLDAIDADLMQAHEDFRSTSLELAEWLSTERDRVRLSEVWYRRYVRGQIMRLPDGSALRFDEKNPLHGASVAAGVVTLESAVIPLVRLSWWAGPHRLADLPSPYPHDAFPYVPFWGYREAETGVPYGLIRGMISPQDEVNSRLARMYWLLSAKRVIADSDAAHRPWDEVVEEAGRPDALILMNPNRRNKDGRIEVQSDFQLSQQQFQVLQDATQAIQDAAGVYQSMLGKAVPGADSGIAINSLVEQGATTLADLNDNYAASRIRVGELLLSLVVARSGNQPMPVTYEFNGESKTYVFNTAPSNTLSALLLRVGLVDVPDTPTYRMQQFKNLTEVLKSLPPELQMAVAHIVVRASDLPQKEEMARIIAQATGQGGQPMTPEQSAQAQQQQQMAQLQQQMAQLQLEEQAAKVAKLQAETDKLRHGAVLDEGRLALDQDKHGLDVIGRAMDAETEAAKLEVAKKQKPTGKGTKPT